MTASDKSESIKKPFISSRNFIARGSFIKQFLFVFIICIGFYLIFFEFWDSINENYKIRSFYDEPKSIDIKIINNFDSEQISRRILVKDGSKAYKKIESKLFAIGAGGGLGNILFEIFSFLGTAKLLNRQPILNIKNTGALNGIVQNIVPSFPHLLDEFKFELISESTKVDANSKGCCRFDDPIKFLDYQQDVIYLNGAYFQSFKYFENIRSEVRKMLITKPSFIVKSDEKIPSALRENFLVCVHIRRGDFKVGSMHEPSNPTFTRLATEFLIKKYEKLNKTSSVVIIGNDMKFAYSVFKDKYFPFSEKLEELSESNYTVIKPPDDSPEYKVIIKKSDREVDLAFSRKYCDSVLITAPSSTFGWWLGYNSKTGNEVYYRNINETSDKVANEMNQSDFYPPEWVMLGTGKDGKIKTVQ